MAPVRIHATAFTHQGAVRAGNEDTIAVGGWIRRLPMAAPVVLEHEIEAPLICLVADGMGGHRAGDVASRAVAEHLCRRAAEATEEAAIVRLLRDRELARRLVAAGRPEAFERYSAGRLAEELEALYFGLRAERSKPTG